MTARQLEELLDRERYPDIDPQKLDLTAQAHRATELHQQLLNGADPQETADLWVKEQRHRGHGFHVDVLFTLKKRTRSIVIEPNHQRHDIN